MDAEDASAIGARARKIRRRRGLRLDVVVGLAGISKSYLGMLEHGQRGFHRRLGWIGARHRVTAVLDDALAETRPTPP
ncbi:MAG TPA: helix-turn-helix domain-containing protein [Pseudonocardiaceae bacterium]|nr:helix-turn-helix domain-containing protein [Pseudonocardiaceae bacterium]